MRPTAWLFLATFACGGSDAGPASPDAATAEARCDRWHQWGGDPGHGGASCAIGQPMERTLARATVDPFAALEASDANGVLLVHMQAPLIDGDDVFLMSKSGEYTSCGVLCGLYDRDSQIWEEKAYRWVNGELQPRWTFMSDSGFRKHPSRRCSRCRSRPRHCSTWPGWPQAPLACQSASSSRRSCSARSAAAF
jgi:hypothetical protein